MKLADAAVQAVRLLARARGGFAWDVKRGDAFASWKGSFGGGREVHVKLEDADVDGLMIVVSCSAPKQQVAMLQQEGIDGEQLAEKLSGLVDLAEEAFLSVLRALRELGSGWSLSDDGMGITLRDVPLRSKRWMEANLSSRFEFGYDVYWRAGQRLEHVRYEHDELDAAIAKLKELTAGEPLNEDRDDISDRVDETVAEFGRRGRRASRSASDQVKVWDGTKIYTIDLGPNYFAFRGGQGETMMVYDQDWRDAETMADMFESYLHSIEVMDDKFYYIFGRVKQVGFSRISGLSGREARMSVDGNSVYFGMKFGSGFGIVLVVETNIEGQVIRFTLDADKEHLMTNEVLRMAEMARLGIKHETGEDLSEAKGAPKWALKLAEQLGSDEPTKLGPSAWVFRLDGRVINLSSAAMTYGKGYFVALGDKHPTPSLTVTGGKALPDQVAAAEEKLQALKREGEEAAARVPQLGEPGEAWSVEFVPAKGRWEVGLAGVRDKAAVMQAWWSTLEESIWQCLGGTRSSRDNPDSAAATFDQAMTTLREWRENGGEAPPDERLFEARQTSEQIVKAVVAVLERRGRKIKRETGKGFTVVVNDDMVNGVLVNVFDGDVQLVADMINGYSMHMNLSRLDTAEELADQIVSYAEVVLEVMGKLSAMLVELRPLGFMRKDAASISAKRGNNRGVGVHAKFVAQFEPMFEVTWISQEHAIESRSFDTDDSAGILELVRGLFAEPVFEMASPELTAKLQKILADLSPGMSEIGYAGKIEQNYVAFRKTGQVQLKVFVGGVKDGVDRYTVILSRRKAPERKMWCSVPKDERAAERMSAMIEMHPLLVAQVEAACTDGWRQDGGDFSLIKSFGRIDGGHSTYVRVMMNTDSIDSVRWYVTDGIGPKIVGTYDDLKDALEFAERFGPERHAENLANPRALQLNEDWSSSSYQLRAVEAARKLKAFGHDPSEPHQGIFVVNVRRPRQMLVKVTFTTTEYDEECVELSVGYDEMLMPCPIPFGPDELCDMVESYAELCHHVKIIMDGLLSELRNIGFDADDTNRYEIVRKRSQERLRVRPVFRTGSAFEAQLYVSWFDEKREFNARSFSGDESDRVIDFVRGVANGVVSEARTSAKDSYVAAVQVLKDRGYEAGMGKHSSTWAKSINSIVCWVQLKSTRIVSVIKNGATPFIALSEGEMTGYSMMVNQRGLDPNELADYMLSYGEFAELANSLLEAAGEQLRPVGFARDNLAHFVNEGPYVDFHVVVTSPFELGYSISGGEHREFGQEYAQEAIEFALEQAARQDDPMFEAAMPRWAVELGKHFGYAPRWTENNGVIVVDFKNACALTAYARDSGGFIVVAGTIDGEDKATFVLPGADLQVEVDAAVEQWIELRARFDADVTEVFGGRSDISVIRGEHLGANIRLYAKDVIVRLSASRLDSQEWLVRSRSLTINDVAVHDDSLSALKKALELLGG